MHRVGCGDRELAAVIYRAPIDDGDAFAMETHRYRHIYNTIRPHQALGDRVPRQAYLARSAKLINHHAVGRMLSADALTVSGHDDLSATPRGRDRSER